MNIIFFDILDNMKVLFSYLFLMCIASAAFFISITSFAQQPRDKQKTINISVISNTSWLDEYKKTIISAYNSLGYRVILYKTPTARSLRLTNSGKLDAELIRVKTIEKKYPNLIRIPVKLANGTLELICNKKVSCNKEILDDSNVTIGITNGSAVSEYFMSNKKANIYKIGSHIGAMLKKERLNYIINVLNKTGVSSFDFNRNEYQEIPLMHIEAYHYVNKKHKTLIPALTEALKKQLLNKMTH